MSDRAIEWAKTMGGWSLGDDLVHAHKESSMKLADFEEVRHSETPILSPNATLSKNSRGRVRPEENDSYRTPFERDRDRILHSRAFRRLAGKTQVFIFPADHQRSRLTHALEVAQVAKAISRRLGLNVDLTEAIAIGHDCGHGPGGHASEDALSPFLDEGYDHAIFGAEVTLAGLNLTMETIDGIRNHSWSLPEPSTPEGVVVSWADRIAYCAHDLEDAIGAKVIGPSDIPNEITSTLGSMRSNHLNYFINAVVSSTTKTKKITMSKADGDLLGKLRRFNYEAIYLRPESVRQSEQVIAVIDRLVRHLIGDRDLYSSIAKESPSSDSELYKRQVIAYVAGMTDRYVFHMAEVLLDIDKTSIPRGLDYR
ncbi:MAG: HD domain-containing protein [Actinomycetota bacterium]|nr:HD domain-containing protein [Actinomycetota bacterium]